MLLCDVDFFDLSLNNIHHDSVEIEGLDDDYLAPSENSIIISSTDAVSERDLIWIHGNVEYFGIVTRASRVDDATEVSFKPFISIFDQDVLFDVTVQNRTPLETVIKNLITTYFKNSGDSYQNVSVLTLATATSTSQWTFNIKSEDENSHYAIVNLYSAIIAPAMSSYGIGIYIVPNFNTKMLQATIQVASGWDFYLDADDDEIEINEFTYKEPSSTTNKLEVWNTENYSEKRTYYLHSDLSYNRTNNDRISPVVLAVSTATKNDSETDPKTFAQAADEVAANTFDGIEWKNYIELTTIHNNILISPLALRLGQRVKIIHGGVVYTSLLTGRKIGEIVTLMFGTIRLDLTKKLRIGG